MRIVPIICVCIAVAIACESGQSTPACVERSSPFAEHDAIESRLLTPESRGATVSDVTPVASDAKADATPTMPTPEQVADRMAAAFVSTPVLHVTVINRHRGLEYECKGWLKAGHARGEVRRDGQLVFATASSDKRVQEFVPKVKFANGVESHNVLIERDPTRGEWFCLLDFDLGCGPAGIAINPYLDNNGRRIVDLLLGNMQTSIMTQTEMNGRACYRYNFAREIDGDLIVWDLYVDKVTFKPVRQQRRITQGNKVKKEDVFDYTFVHLASDDGIEWKLDPAKLKQQVP